MPAPAPVSIYGYLSEPAATNRANKSEDLGGWTGIRATIVANAAYSPLGNKSLSAAALKDTTANDTHYMYGAVISAPWASGSRGIFSVFLKAVNKTWAYLYSASYGIYYDLSNRAVGNSTATGGATIHATGIENWGDGWCRCWVDCTPGTDTNSIYIMSAHANADSDYAGTDTTAILIYGPQLEVTSTGYPTSYVPVPSTGAVTRNKDQLYFKGDDGNVFNTGVGSGFSRIYLEDYTQVADQCILNLNDGGSSADMIEMQVNELVSTINASGGDGGTVSGVVDCIDGDMHMAQITWETDELKQFVDGVQDGSTDTSVDIPDDLDRINIGNDEAEGSHLAGLICDVELYSRKGQKIKKV